MSGKLILCATPIGNLEDASPRLLRTLETVDVVACEDPRRTRKLLTHFAIRARDLVVYNEGNERRQARGLVDRLKRGDVIALVSDAGVPGLSDPGYRLVAAAIEANVDITIVPGPSAAISALAISGLPPGRFVFEGFLPRKAGDRSRRIAELARERRTLVFYVPPHRVEEHLADLREGLGNRRAVLVRELTKLFEGVQRGTLDELLERARDEGPRGEMVLVVAGEEAVPAAVSAQELAGRARALMSSGVDRKDALAQVARDAGVPKRRVFDSLVSEKDEA